MQSDNEHTKKSPEKDKRQRLGIVWEIKKIKRKREKNRKKVFKKGNGRQKTFFNSSFVVKKERLWLMYNTDTRTDNMERYRDFREEKKVFFLSVWSGGCDMNTSTNEHEFNNLSLPHCYHWKIKALYTFSPLFPNNTSPDIVLLVFFEKFSFSFSLFSDP